MKPALRLTFIVALCLASFDAAFASGDKFWLDVGDIGGPVFWVAGLGSSLVQDGHLGWDHTARTADGFLATLVVGEGIDLATREKRPYGNSLDSFPSDHASLSFEIAAAQSYYHPKQAFAWYGVATLIAYSRIPAHEHHWQDVIAGAALGYGGGQLSVSSRHGWFLAPIIENSRLGGSLMFSQKL
jgi:membrane-associated phospholipid phosphatase